MRACCVVGAPHADLGEVPVAFVVFHEGNTAPESVIRDQVAAELPRACVPARIVSIDALPEIGIGKVDRKLLKQLAAKA
ncbi:Triostin synthetase I [compost metagenome]